MLRKTWSEYAGSYTPDGLKSAGDPAIKHQFTGKKYNPAPLAVGNIWGLQITAIMGADFRLFN